MGLKREQMSRPRCQRQRITDLACSLGPRLHVWMHTGPSLGLRARFTGPYHCFATGRVKSVRSGRSCSYFHTQKVGSVGLDPDNGQLCSTPLMGFTKLMLVNLCHLLVEYKVTGRVTNVVAKRSDR